MFDAHVADAAGSLTTDSDAGEDGIRHGAVGDQYVLGGLEERIRFHAAAALDGNAVVTRRDVAALNADVLARVDIDTIAIAGDAANREVLVEHVLAVGCVQAPHEALLIGGEVLEAHVATTDGLSDRGMAQRILRIGPAADFLIAGDLACTDDARVAGLQGVDQAEVSLNPLAFPSDLAHGVVGQVGRSNDVRVVFEAQDRMGAEREGAGEIVARGDHHFATAQNPAAVDGLLQRGGIFGDAVAFGSEIADVESEVDLSRGDGTRGRALGGLIRRSSADQPERHK